ncbi:hypothetical protein BDN72DRAFT_197392 [Pluteus cervinus]|uniref:Uncharacterized protein n=1 Tax=Pluteus cervinus TaxID=181527 RepID=A0ACD3AIH8_9AGAR|nr:hypothetical protein BDN72DRAFT_197392 [Pluteus cervinus]
MKRLTHVVFKTRKKRAVELPLELWVIIASYLSREELCRLMGVNRALNDLAMDAKYGVVEFAETDPWKFVKKVERLLQSPFNGRRTRSLIIFPEGVREAIEKTETSLERTPSHASILPPPKSKPRFMPAFVHSRVSGRQPVEVSSETNVVDGPITYLSPAQRKELYFRTLEMLSGVINLEIHFQKPVPAWDRPLQPANQFPVTEVVDMWTLLPLSKLRDLTLAMDTSVFIKAFGADTFKSLKSLLSLDLQLRFTTVDHDMNASVVSVINSTRNSLEELRFGAWGHHPNLSPIINGIHLPKLRSLSLRLPFDSRHVHDTTCFMTLLDRHRLIRNLKFRTMACYDSFGYNPHDEVHAHLTWLSRSFRVFDGDGNLMKFPGITSLNIVFKSLYNWVSQVDHTTQNQPKLGSLLVDVFPNVVDLTLGAVVFRFEDLEETLGSFASLELVGMPVGDDSTTTHRVGWVQGLRRLEVLVETLTSELVLLFADQCPQLQCLVLHAEAIFSVGAGGTGIEEFVDSMETFRTNNTNQSRLGEATLLQSWCLEDHL